MSMFHVNKNEIMSLDDTQARELVARLCKAEVAKHGFSQRVVSWGGDQRAPDGGVDVDVCIENGQINDFILRAKTVFQVKAVNNFGASHVKSEMAAKGDLSPILLSLDADAGAYIIASTKSDLSASSLKTRKDAMQELLVEHNLNNLIVDFYDARKIADWVEKYPTIVNWLKTTLGQPFSGWQPYAPWAYSETDLDSEYILDDKVKMYLPNGNEATIQDAITSLRSDLSIKNSVRLVGLSGVGKTRLVQALFDERIETAAEVLDAGNVFYTDLSDNPNPSPQALLEGLISENSGAILIVDNCGEQLHSNLTEKVNKHAASIKLLTVEYDIRDDLPTGTQCYKLESSSEELIRQLLKPKFTYLSDLDIFKIAEFSDGNSRVAFALASSSETTGELARLRDQDLFKRLFNQNHHDSQELYTIARYASLVYSFDIENEVEFLSALSGVAVRDFKRGLITLQSRGLLQHRGIWRAVLPHAISNRLAAEALEELSEQDIVRDFLDSAPERLILSFSRRLGYLHESAQAKSLVVKWLQPGGRFADLTNSQLLDCNYKVFKNLAPVYPEVALVTIESHLGNANFCTTENHNRDEITRLLVHLAYEPNFFERAVNALVKFALSEPVDRNHNSTRRELQGLFHISLSGTDASPSQRLEVLTRLIQSSDDREQELGLLCLEAALPFGSGSYVHSSDFGARKRGYGWLPKTYDDVLEWYLPLIELIQQLGLNDNSLGARIRKLFAQSLRNLIMQARLLPQLRLLIITFSERAIWPEGWLAIKETLVIFKDSLSSEVVDELSDLVNRLAPKNDKSQILSMICCSGYHDREESDYDKPFRDAEALGTKIANDALLFELLPCLVSPEANIVSKTFGKGVGGHHHNPRQLIDLIRTLVPSQKASGISLDFVSGILRGWNASNPEAVQSFLERSVEDAVWGEFFPWLELSLRPTLAINSYPRFMRALSLGMAPAFRYQSLCSGMALDGFSPEEINSLVIEIAKLDGGIRVSADILSQVIFQATEKDDNYRIALAQACLSYLVQLDWHKLDGYNDMQEYNLQKIIDFAATSEDSKGIELLVVKYTAALLNREGYGYWRFSFFLNDLMMHYPNITLETIYKHYQIDDAEYVQDCLEDAFVKNFRGNRNVKDFDTKTIIDWCDQEPQKRYLFVAKIFPLFVPRKRSVVEDEQNSVLSELAKLLLKKVSDTPVLLDIYRTKFCPSGWSGNLSVILEARLVEFQKLQDVIKPEFVDNFNQVMAGIEIWIQKEKQNEVDRDRQESERFE